MHIDGTGVLTLVVAIPVVIAIVVFLTGISHKRGKEDRDVNYRRNEE